MLLGEERREGVGGEVCACKGNEYIENHNSLGHERPLGLDVKLSPNAQDVFWPIPGLISSYTYCLCCPVPTSE